MKDTIHLPIKKQWFDMILSGEKKEEYREVKPFYNRMLLGLKGEDSNYPVPSGEYERPAKTITLTNGYGKNLPRIEVELLGIEVNFPKPEWCPPETCGVWYVLKLGKVLNSWNLKA